MGLDVMKILDDINPSPKAMKWIIVILCTFIGTSYIYEKLTSKSKDDIIFQLQKDVDDLKKIKSEQNNFNILLSKKDDVLNTKIDGCVVNVKTYIDNRLEFVVTNQDTKNKNFILSVFKMSNVSASSLIPNIQEKSLSEPTPIIENKIEDTISINKEQTIEPIRELKSEPIVIKREIINIKTKKDTLKENKIKGFFKKIF